VLDGGERGVRRLAVLGSSIGVVARPQGTPYPSLLERLLNERSDGELWMIDNLCEIAGIADDLDRLLAAPIALRPDVVVLHYGHVEALRRPHSRRMWRWAKVARADLYPRRRRVRKIVFRRYSSLRRRLGLCSQWTPLPRFERVLDRALAQLRKDTAARLILIEATPPTPRIERYAPGAAQELERYNGVLRRLAAAHGAELVTTEDVRQRDPELRDPEVMTPDGSHYSPRTHAAVAVELAERIEALLLSRAG
jgi:lysophospholipase L1-like esterase